MTGLFVATAASFKPREFVGLDQGIHSNNGSMLSLENEGVRNFVLRDTKPGSKIAQTPTLILYAALLWAFNHFNQLLFGGELPDVILTLRKRGPNCYGYYLPNAFVDQVHGGYIAEIALNPAYFRESLALTLATLVHQMAHHWQHQQGSASRPTYHNREWANKMIGIGLKPIGADNTREKETGQCVSQYPLDEGAFEIARADLMKQGFNVRWAEAIQETSATKSSPPKKKPSRIEWVCEKCDQTVTGDASSHIFCGLCRIQFVRADRVASSAENPPDNLALADMVAPEHAS